MDLTGYVEALRIQLATAAAAGGDEAVELAERLTGPLDAAARLILQDAVADAAQEITRDLAPGSVEVRLRGRDLSFVVSPPPTFDAADEPDAGAGQRVARNSEPTGEGVPSRISFRPPDHLKARIEDAAEREGLSVNAFLVKTLIAALDPGKAATVTTDSKGAARVDGWFR